jgi:hypothetical protein
MIPDNVCIWCHSFWRNDLFQPLFQAVPGVILFGSMRVKNYLQIMVAFDPRSVQITLVSALKSTLWNTQGQ